MADKAVMNKILKRKVCITLYFICTRFERENDQKLRQEISTGGMQDYFLSVAEVLPMGTAGVIPIPPGHPPPPLEPP